MNDNKKKSRRRRRFNKKNTEVMSLNIFSCNSASLRKKLFSMEKIFSDVNPSIFCLQETHFIKEGNIKFKNDSNFLIFEKIRSTKKGGGLATGVIKDLNPIWICDGGENVEALTLKISVREMKIRIINAYGPQEYDEQQKKVHFWNYLDREINECQNEGSGCLIFMDGNAWLGPSWIKQDPHMMNKNGELFESFLIRNPNMTLLNAADFCEGSITRERTVNIRENSKIERSIIDFVLVCNKVFPFVSKFLIDEKHIYTLSNFSGKKIVQSDHNSLITRINLNIEKTRPERRTVFNFKDVEGLKKFKFLSSKTDKFTNIFNQNSSFTQMAKKWAKLLKRTVHLSFKKVRINKRPKQVNNCIYKKYIRATEHGNEEAKTKFEALLKKEEAKINMEKLRQNIKILNQNISSKQQNIWKVKNKFFNKIKPSLPIGKKNLSNKIVTEKMELKKVYSKHFQHRMRSRPIMTKFRSYEANIEKKFKEALLVTKGMIFPDWTICDLERVLKSLKRNQSQDTFELVNELFMIENIGSNLKDSLIFLFNGIKNNTCIPDFFRNVFITAIPKKKKLQWDLQFERGIFLVPKVRVIFMKMVYNSIINILEDNLSRSNIGARKRKSPRDHLFTLYSVVNETLNRKEPVDLVFYDLSQAFDSLWVQHTLLDCYDNGITNNLLNVMFEMSKKANIFVKTPVGITDSKEINDTIMQGESVSSILCTNSMDKISKDCQLKAYSYRGKVDVPKMGFVDDIVDVNKCGQQTKEMNEYTTSAVNKRRLQFNIDKCVRMHISNKLKQTESCENLSVDKWESVKISNGSKVNLKDKYRGKVSIKTVKSHLYLGDTVADNASNSLNIKSRVSKGQAVINNILEILEGTYFGDFYFDTMKLLRESMFLSVITNNLEVSFNLTKKDLKPLEDLDQQLLRKCTMTSSKSSRTLTLLELGLSSVTVEIQRKRVLYLHHLLTSNDSLAKDILNEMIKFPLKNDWILTIKRDLEELNINLSYDEISTFSKSSFKKLTKKASKTFSFLHLMKEKAKLSKGSDLNYNELKTQNYLVSGNGLSVHLMRSILQTRIRDLQLKCNFRNAYADTKCLVPLCMGEDRTRHIYECPFLCPTNQVSQNLLAFQDIFGCDVKKQSEVMFILKERLQERSKYITPENKTRGPGGPRKERKVSLVTREAKHKKYHKQVAKI